jgi:hypothetical protein
MFVIGVLVVVVLCRMWSVRQYTSYLLWHVMWIAVILAASALLKFMDLVVGDSCAGVTVKGI